MAIASGLDHVAMRPHNADPGPLPAFIGWYQLAVDTPSGTALDAFRPAGSVGRARRSVPYVTRR